MRCWQQELRRSSSRRISTLWWNARWPRSQSGTLPLFTWRAPRPLSPRSTTTSSPLYCKLHGDFRYESIKNLSADLKTQDAELGKCFAASATRFGLVVGGYSGRDESVVALMEAALAGQNPFPHGFYWLGIKGRPPLRVVTELIQKATASGVRAAFVEIETLDSLLSRLWNQVPNKDPKLDAIIVRSAAQSVSIPLPPAGNASPIVRVNALPVLRLPDHCQRLTFTSEKDWSDVHAAEESARDEILCTKSDTVWAWGDEATLKRAFCADLIGLAPISIAAEIGDLSNNLHLKGFLERGIALALARGKPLVVRSSRGDSALIVDNRSASTDGLQPLQRLVGNLHGAVPGVSSEVSEEHPKSEPLNWAEAVRIDLQSIDGKFWLVLRPDVWIWPRWARKQATGFLDKRTGGRYNQTADKLLTAWIDVLLPGHGLGHSATLEPFGGPNDAGHPQFELSSRTAFSRRLQA